MIVPQLTIPQWLGLPIHVRDRLKILFNIPKSAGSMVENNKVISDGHTNEDLLRVSLEAMQTYLGSTETEFYALLNQVVEKIEKEINNEEIRKQELKAEQNALEVEQYQKDVVEAIKNVSELAEVVVKKRGRPAKKV